MLKRSSYQDRLGTNVGKAEKTAFSRRILRLQEKKRLIFEGTVGQSNAALARLTEEDLRFLFS
jgi:hypothetical protein